MVTNPLQLSAQPNKNLQIYVGKNVGMWAKMWADFGDDLQRVFSQNTGGSTSRSATND
jgi:hypothetical protein